jgi:hypothetical protein
MKKGENAAQPHPGRDLLPIAGGDYTFEMRESKIIVSASIATGCP